MWEAAASSPLELSDHFPKICCTFHRGTYSQYHIYFLILKYGDEVVLMGVLCG